MLRSLPLRFHDKVSCLEERKDLDSLTMDELHGILTTYEMRTDNEKRSREAAFKFQIEQKTKSINLMKFELMNRMKNKQIL